ncbi:MAG: protein kinase [Planctomycetaceae bacterium]|nr:protein kinase [Planctomycetaceae bacterium]
MPSEETTRNSDSKWIWPFEILEQIGEGGMGVVYRARYVVNDRIVALKMLPGDVTDKTALARFDRELEVLKSLKHPNIVRCFGGTSKDKRRFYAMELVEGGTLEDRLQERGRLPWEEVIEYGLQICAALEASHSANVVHRDIKPSNFLITPDGRVKLSDFGLASVEASRKITAAGKTAGTFLYMAPEQIRGKEVTPQTDLYALGCVFYELITGKPPFVGDTPAQTLHLHCHEKAPRPTAIALDCPVSLEQLILRLLEKNPSDRPVSATAVARDLRIVSQTVTIKSRPSPLQGKNEDPPPTLKTVELGARLPEMEKALPVWVLFLLGAVLAGSLFFNFVQHQHIRHLHQWQEMGIAATKDTDERVRIAAYHSLGEVADTSPESIDALIRGLDDPIEIVRRTATSSLARGGRIAKKAIPTLIRLQKEDPSADVRAAATAAIDEINSGKAPSRFPWGTLTVGSILTVLLILGGYVVQTYRK